MSKISSLHQQVLKSMDNGDLDGAKKLVYEILNFSPNYFVSYVASGLLIDVGSARKDEGMVRKGVDLLERDFESIINKRRFAPTAYYNLANGYYVVFNFKLRADPWAACFKKTELNTAIELYRKALGYDIDNPLLASKIWVNLGNCYDHLGRVLDALECYEKALELKPDHGMALGNKGQALLYYARVAGEHQRTFLREAHSLFSQALKLSIPPEARGQFHASLARTKKLLAGEDVENILAKYPAIRIKAESKFEQFLINFCLKHRLYLNSCSFCKRCSAAVGDTITIKTMIASINDDSYTKFSSYLNHIKQDYVLYRFLLVLSRWEGINLDFVDGHVTIIDTLDQSLHNVYIQLVKASFKGFYDILDKIACFINEYLKLGIPETKTYFSNLWYYDVKTETITKKTITKKIENTRSLPLNALFNLHRDLEGRYVKLKRTRNALTHRFVNVRHQVKSEDPNNMTEDTLVNQTLELAGLVRNAIIYLTYFVYVEEMRKKSKAEGFLPPIYAQAVPDKIKSIRPRQRIQVEANDPNRTLD